MKKNAQVIIIPTPGIGNLVPAVEFAHHLIHREHRLSATVLVIPIPHRPQVTAYVNARAATTEVQFLHLPPVDLPTPDQFQTSLGFVSVLIEKHKAHVKDIMADLVSSTQPDSVPLAGLFIDMFCTPMIDVAGEIGVPCYLFFASPASFLGFMLHLPTLHAQLATDSDTELTIPSFANSVPVQVVFPTGLLNTNEDRYTWFLHYALRYRETKGIIVNTFLELEHYALDSISSASDIPPVYPVGPVLDLHGPARWDLMNLSLEKNIIQWLDLQPAKAVVFLCFGSMGSLSGAQVREIAKGLERAGYRFLWSLREPPKTKLELPSDYANLNLEEILPDGFLKRTAEIGLVCGWVPQVSILSHEAIGGFVSHCGWNSILESLWYGVPTATWPIYAEQQMNAFEMVMELGLAVEIKLDYWVGSDLVLSEQVERGVRLLMDGDGDGDGEVRRKVKEMREMSRVAVEENGSSYVSLGNLIDKLLATI
ncbi:UDP-glycosyltransferase [Actinidia chinensis var. chinensis]|uniref:Glycosyltransferase n=1 Tax=Actinidia chinensis var. chinensis TaxID=1590841 RepID=A0A2R6QMC8_ACTCC|nr:UDP-glycosyltransferase [Actinidia chinensis var. chinensis]